MTGGALDQPTHEISRDMGALLARGEPGTAIQAVWRIRAWHDAMRTLSAIAEAQVMQACWVIRREHSDRGDFDAFCAAQGLAPIMGAPQAWLMAETWDVARRQRPLRELAADRPTDAIAFVRGFVEAGHEEDLRELDEDDQRVVEILAAPPRARRSKIRALLESHQERLDLEPPEPPPPPPPPDVSGELEARVGDLQDVVRSLDRLADVIPELLLRDAGNRARRERIPLFTDLGIGSLERIASAAGEAGGCFAGGD